jgi:hypothetical protein
MRPVDGRRDGRGPVADIADLAALLVGDAARARDQRRANRGADLLIVTDDNPRTSVRGLSSVTMSRSAPRAAAAPIGPRLPVSRSPPAPTTTANRPRLPAVARWVRNVAITDSTAAGLWA